MFCLSFLSQDNEKRTPLHAAAYLGDAEIIELLILSGMVSSVQHEHIMHIFVIINIYQN